MTPTPQTTQDDRSDPYMSPPLKRAGDTTSACLFQGLKTSDLVKATVEEEDVDEEEDCTVKHVKLAQFNALKQAERVLKHPVVSNMREKEGWPKVYALVYLFEDGKIHDLDFEKQFAEKSKLI